MAICDTHNPPFIFLHNQKTAGVSIRAAICEAIKPKGCQFTNYYQHDSAQQAKARLLFPGEYGNLCYKQRYGEYPDFFCPLGIYKWEDYYKFGFVRNPFDWIVSWYYFHSARLQQKGDTLADNFITWIYQHGIVKGQTQKDFLSDADGNISLDFVGRFEDLDNDYQVICDKLGIENHLGHLNESTHKPYREEYQDDEKAIQIVESRYREDLDYFGYKF